MRTETLLIRDFSLKSQKCNFCHRPIEREGILDDIKNPITNRLNSVYFHISCYTPRNFNRYKLKDDITNPDAIALIEGWNSQFTPPKVESFVPENPTFTISSFTYSRSWLEIFKFFSPEEIIHLSPISKSFYMYSWNQEIWAEVTRIIKPLTKDIKIEYLRQKFNTCIKCGEPRTNLLVYDKFLKRCYCAEKCNKQPGLKDKNSFLYSLVSIDYLLKQYRINRTFIERNNIPVIQDSEFFHKTYPIFIQKALKSPSASNRHAMETRKRQKVKED